MKTDFVVAGVVYNITMDVDGNKQFKFPGQALDSHNTRQIIEESKCMFKYFRKYNFRYKLCHKEIFVFMFWYLCDDYRVIYIVRT